MPFCRKCRFELTDDDSFCPKCGTPNALADSGDNKIPVDAKNAHPELVEGEGNPSTRPSGPAQDERNQDTGQTIARGKTPYGIVGVDNLPEGHVIDERYEIKRKIGQGGFGAVYLAWDRVMEIDKALKVIPEAIVNDREAMENLRQEAKTMIGLNHPNILRVYDFHQTGLLKFIDMEYIDGPSLADVKLDAEGKRLSEDRVKELGIQIAAGMGYAHGQRVIHKDIKPQNILLTGDDKVKVMDFGIAETVRTSMSRLQSSTSAGTLMYMSPEQLRGKEVGKEADIYSFGAMLYELLSGNPPFCRGDIQYQVLNEKPEVLEGVSEGMNALVMKCLEKDYLCRYRSFEELLKFANEPDDKRELFQKQVKAVDISSVKENKTQLGDREPVIPVSRGKDIDNKIKETSTKPLVHNKIPRVISVIAGLLLIVFAIVIIYWYFIT